MQLRGGVRHGGLRHDVSQRGFGLRELSRVGRTKVDLEAARLGHHVGPRPAGDDPDVAGHRRPAAVEVMEGLDHSGRGEDCAPALFRLDPGVRRPSADGHGHLGDALAGAHDVAVGPGALEDQGRVMVRREAPDDRAGEG